MDVALSYIALAFGLLILNCLCGGIGGGIVPYKVYWNIDPSRPFASSIAIGMRSLLLRSKSPIMAFLPGTGGSDLVLLVLLSFFLSKS